MIKKGRLKRAAFFYVHLKGPVIVASLPGPTTSGPVNK